MLAHQMPMLISICDHVFMGTEEKKGSVDCLGVSASPLLCRSREGVMK